MSGSPYVLVYCRRDKVAEDYNDAVNADEESSLDKDDTILLL